MSREEITYSPLGISPEVPRVLQNTMFWSREAFDVTYDVKLGVYTAANEDPICILSWPALPSQELFEAEVKQFKERHGLHLLITESDKAQASLLSGLMNPKDTPGSTFIYGRGEDNTALLWSEQPGQKDTPRLGIAYTAPDYAIDDQENVAMIGRTTERLSPNLREIAHYLGSLTAELLPPQDMEAA